MELILQLFDVFTIGRDSSCVTRPMNQDQYKSVINKERYKLEDASEYIIRIFTLPCISYAEIAYIKTLLVDILDTVRSYYHA